MTSHKNANMDLHSKQGSNTATWNFVHELISYWQLVSAWNHCPLNELPTMKQLTTYTYIKRLL